jgi:alkylhydroperoxidase/carboxymuconolactone decarboxylase family protein YurZ
MSQLKPLYVQLIEKHDPSLLETLGMMNALVHENGALSAKTKILMSLLSDAILGRPEGVKALARMARAAGSTEEEIAETVRVAFNMGGLPALVCATNAYKED